MAPSIFPRMSELLKERSKTFAGLAEPLGQEEGSGRKQRPHFFDVTSGHRLHLRPLERELDRTKLIEMEPGKAREVRRKGLLLRPFGRRYIWVLLFFQVLYSGDEIKEKVESGLAMMSEDHSLPEFPKVTFLGTGSGVPERYRNVSCILVQVDKDNYFMMDCGEGKYPVLHFFALVCCYDLF